MIVQLQLEKKKKPWGFTTAIFFWITLLNFLILDLFMNG